VGQSQFVSLAIDHGVNHSCIARMTPGGPRVIPAEPEGAILPSAVYYDSRGGLRVGSAALRAINTTSAREGQGYTGFKLHIGGDKRFEFPAARKSLTAPELTATLIQTLVRASFKETGDEATACVITIPAKFKQNSVEGTRAAAQMAGLKYCPLIMEPVAAAMCYGFGNIDQSAPWMIFDLGGGTLDVSLVVARHGKLVIPQGGHAGDDNLGGSKFDNELVGYVLDELGKQYKLSAFRNRRQQFSNEWGRLLLAVEEARIRLLTQQAAFVQLLDPLCRDDNKKEVRVNVPVTRKIYDDLIRPDAERAVKMCRMLLETNRMKASEVGRLILIGGATKTPLIRQLLADRLGIPIECSVNPATTVVEGAAIYADTIEIPEVLRAPVKRVAGGYSLRLEYERQSPVATYGVVGIVDGPNLHGLRVEIERDGHWKSAQIAVDPTGVFSVEVVLAEGRKPVLSQFRTTLLDAQGRELARIDGPQIWYPSVGVENRLTNSLRVTVRGGATKVLIPGGSDLPAEGTVVLRTPRALRRGTKGDLMCVAIVESVTTSLGKEDDRADGCLHVGTLRILGSHARLTSDIPAGSEIEVKVCVDELRAITAKAYIPYLDEEFEAVFRGEKFEYKLGELPARLNKIEQELRNIEKQHAERPVQEVGEVLESLRRQKLIESVALDLERANAGDRDAEVRAYKRIIEMEGALRSLRRMQSQIDLGATGATTQDDREEATALVLQDVTSHTLGILTHPGKFRRLIPKESRIPAEVTVDITNEGPSDAVEVFIYQGESDNFFENTLIGKLPIPLPERKASGYWRFEVTFKLNNDGLLSVLVKRLNDGQIFEAAVQCSVPARLDRIQQELRNAVHCPEGLRPIAEGDSPHSLQIARGPDAVTLVISENADPPVECTFWLDVLKPDDADLCRVTVLESFAIQGKNVCIQKGILRVPANDATRTVPPGSEVELRVLLDESRTLHAVAWVPFLGREVDTVFDPHVRSGVR
jgi:molecular chaperone DnaK